MSHRIVCCLLAGLMTAGLLSPAPARAEVAPETAAKIQSALPTEARAVPKFPRRLLVFNLCKGFVHSSIPAVAEAIKGLGERTGAFEAVMSEDPAVFAASSLAQYDAVLFNNTTGTLFTEPEYRDALMNFVRSGHGVVGIHAATDCFYDWAEFGEMMGGYFDGHPWGSGDTETLRIDDPLHPLNVAFKGQGLVVQDEIYQFRAPYSRNNLRVLVTLDTARTDMNKKGINRADGDFAVSWLRAWGQGRVFYCSLGHNDGVLFQPAVLAHYLDGIQYALGDLEADATPSALLSPAYFEKSKLKAEEGRVQAMFETVRNYTVGQDAAPLEQVAQFVVEAAKNPAQRVLTESLLAQILESTATLDAKQFVCRQLYLLGADASVPALAKLLASPETVDMACYALERAPSPAADEALAAALGTADARVKIALINALGQRRSAQAISPLTECLNDTMPEEVVRAALIALGRITGDAACNALLLCRRMAAAWQPALDEALLVQAAESGVGAGAGTHQRSIVLYREVFWNGAPQSRGAALRGLVLAGVQNREALLDEALQTLSLETRRAAAMSARDARSPELMSALAARFPQWDAQAQLLMLDALKDAQPGVASPMLKAALSVQDETVVAAALAAIATAGDTGLVQAAVPFLVASETLAKAARSALAALPGKDATDALAAEAAQAQGPAKAALIAALGERRTPHAVEALLSAAADPDTAVRGEAFRALNAVGAHVDGARVLERLLAEQDAGVRTLGETALVSALRKGGIERVLEAHAASTQPEVRASLLRVLGALGAEQGLEALANALSGAPAPEQQAALESLCAWPSAAAAPALLAATEKWTEQQPRDTAWQGAIQTLAKGGSTLSPQKMLELYTKALALAASVEQKKLVLAGVASVEDPGSIDLIKTCAGVPELQRDVTEALERASHVKYFAAGVVPVLKSTQLTLDGMLDDWRRFPIQLQDERQGVNGAFRLEWTDEGLWVAAEVYDRSVVGGGAPELLWERDSIQIAIDPLDENTETYGPHSIEIGVAPAESGAQVHAWHLAQGTDPALVAQIAAKVRQDKQLTLYEVKIPWAVLAPMQAQPEKPFGINLIINDLDEDRPRRAIEWTSGTLTEKKPSAFTTLMLIGEL